MKIDFENQNLMLESDIAKNLGISVATVRLYRGERIIQPKLTFYRKLALYDVIDVAQALSVKGKSDIVRSAACQFLRKRQVA